jgi:hypothetical protein
VAQHVQLDVQRVVFVREPRRLRERHREHDRIGRPGDVVQIAVLLAVAHQHGVQLELLGQRGAA